jgi:enoyl-CoA hydratase/carnithine racemase
MLTIQDGIAVITLGNPPVNALGHALLERIVLQIEAAQGGLSVRSR